MTYPKLPEGWNLNTWVQLVSLATMLFVAGVAWNKYDSRTSALEEWQSRHTEDHKNRKAEVDANAAKLEAEVRAVENDVATLERFADRIGDRVSAAEARNSQTEMLIRDLTKQVGEVSSDVKVSNEILKRLEAGRGG